MLAEKVQKFFDYTPFGWLANGLESRFGAARTEHKLTAEVCYVLGTGYAFGALYEGATSHTNTSALAGYLTLVSCLFTLGVWAQHTMGAMSRKYPLGWVAARIDDKNKQ